MLLCYSIETYHSMAERLCYFPIITDYNNNYWINISCNFYEYEYPRGAICLPIYYSPFSAAGLLSRRFTTVPCANTPSLPSEVRLFGADTGWEKRSNKRKEYISFSFPTWTTVERRASPPVQTIWPENSMWKLGWREKRATLGKATSRITKPSSLV